MQVMDIGEVHSHFSSDLSDEIKRFAMHVVFLKSRYIFTWRQGKQQFGYCTHCGVHYQTNGLYHKEKAHCPHCDSYCLIQASGISRKYMVDYAYFLYYEKSIVDPNVIVARGIYAVRDYRGDYTKVKTQYAEAAHYVFQLGGGAMAKRSCYYDTKNCLIKTGQFELTSSSYALNKYGSHFGNIHFDYSNGSIIEAVKGTPFQYSTWDKYSSYDTNGLVEFFALYSRYPCVEYLTKIGAREIVETKLRGRQTYGAINWHGKDLLKVLKITKQEFRELQKLRVRVSCYLLYLIQTAKKQHWDLTISDLIWLDDELGGDWYLKQLLNFRVFDSLKTIIRYLKKQTRKYPKHFVSGYSTFSHWRDYLDDCKLLKMDVQNESIRYPTELYEAHQNTILRVQMKQNAKLDRKIRKRAKELQNYVYQYRGLIIRPAASYSELLKEGNVLQHCVARYGERYAEGNTIILFIRQVDTPKKPYFTVEVTNGDIQQVRGLKNCNPGGKVKAFVEAFKKAKLKKTKMKKSA